MDTAAAMKAYHEIIEFVTSFPSLEEIVRFQPNEDTLERAEYLKQSLKSGSITADEKYELKEYDRAQHFVYKLKIRAQRRLMEPALQ